MGFLHKLRGISILTGTLITVLVLNVVQLGSFLFWPFFKEPVHRFNCRMAEFVWDLLLRYARRFGGLRIVFSGDELPTRADGLPESAFVFSNHSSWTDWSILFALAQKQHALSYVKFFAKNSVQYIPAFGLGMKLLGFIFLSRDFEKDKKTMAKSFSFLKSMHHPAWLFSFLEGHRFSKKLLKESQEYAKNNKRPLLNHVLLPRYKGFQATIEAMKDKLDAVYDVTLGYPDRVPSLVDLVAGDKEWDIHVHVSRIPIADVPVENVAQWCDERYVAKDALLSRFEQFRRFTLQEGEQDGAVGPSSSSSSKKGQEGEEIVAEDEVLASRTTRSSGRKAPTNSRLRR